MTTQSSIKWYEWKPGQNNLRILPGYDPRHCEANPDLSGPLPKGARRYFAAEVKRSTGVGPNNRMIFIKPSRPGPLEEYIDRLNQQGDEASKREADSIRPRCRALFFVIDRDNEDEGPQCVDWNLIDYNKILALLFDPKHGDITCPFNGTDVVFEYVPKHKSYNGFPQWPTIRPRRQASVLTEDDEKWHEWLGRDHIRDAGIDLHTSEEFIRACLEGAEEGVEEFEPPDQNANRYFWMKVTADDVRRLLEAGEDREILAVSGSEKACLASEAQL